MRVVVLFLLLFYVGSCVKLQRCAPGYDSRACFDENNVMKELESKGVKYIYGMLHDCTIFVMRVTDIDQWNTFLEVAKKAPPQTRSFNCDVSGMTLGFVYTGDEITSLKAVNTISGQYEELILDKLPTHKTFSSLESTVGDRCDEPSASILTENALGYVCGNPKAQSGMYDYYVNLVIIGSSTEQRYCVSNFNAGIVPFSLGFVMANSSLSEDLDVVLTGPKSAFVKFFIKLYHKQHIIAILATALSLLAIPFLVVCGRSYHTMLVAAARFHVALDALIATNCDNLEHIKQRQQLLESGGFDNIRLKGINLTQSELKSKSIQLDSIRGSAKTVNKSAASKSTSVENPAKLNIAEPPGKPM